MRSPDPLSHIASAVIFGALEDWKLNTRRYQRAAAQYTDEAVLRMLDMSRKSLLDFFSSDWCEALCEMAGIGYEQMLCKAGIIKQVW